jgi:hypothetical protein
LRYKDKESGRFGGKPGPAAAAHEKTAGNPRVADGSCNLLINLIAGGAD